MRAGNEYESAGRGGWALVVAAALLSSACTTTVLQSTRPLAAGETRKTFSLEAGGPLPVPRAGFAYEHGFAGTGDVSLFAGTNLLVTDLAAGGRLYAGPVSLAAKVGTRWSAVSGRLGAALTGELRAVTLTSDRMPFYGGVFGVGMWGLPLSAEALPTDGIQQALEAGLLLGFEWKTPISRISPASSMQVELTVTPLGFSPQRPDENWRLGGGEIPVAASLFQLGLGFHY